MILPENFPIRPRDIDLQDNFLSTFGKHEPEMLAKAIIFHCSYYGYWISFGEKELISACEKYRARLVSLEWLLQKGFLEKDKNDRYCVTEKFIAVCPLRKEAQK